MSAQEDAGCYIDCQQAHDRLREAKLCVLDIVAELADLRDQIRLETDEMRHAGHAALDRADSDVSCAIDDLHAAASYLTCAVKEVE